MISEKNNKKLKKSKDSRKKMDIISVIIFFSIFSICYFFNVTYNESNELFVDKLIDVSSIFFGVFVGSIYLFKKLNYSYKGFIKFSKRLLFQNLIIIFFSFLIILLNEKFPSNLELSNNFSIRLDSLVFSFYVGGFTLILWNIYRFIRIITFMLKSK